MSSQRRDRHGRGLRGPLALPNALTARRAQPPHPASKADFFSEAVHDAVDRVGLQCPDVLVGITFGIEDVPHFDMAWSGDQVPLAAAVETPRASACRRCNSTSPTSTPGMTVARSM